MAHALRLQRFDRLDDLKWTSSDGQYIRYAYAHSWLAVQRLVERFGMHAVADLVRRSGPGLFADTFIEVLGLSLVEFEAELEQSLHQKLLAPGVALYRDDFAVPGRRWRRSWMSRRRSLSLSGWGVRAARDGRERRYASGLEPSPFSDFQAELDARLTPAVEGAAVFLDVRIQPDDARYRFSVDPSSGRFALHWVQATEAIPMIESTPSPVDYGGAAVIAWPCGPLARRSCCWSTASMWGVLMIPATAEGRIGFGLTSPHGQPTEARFANLLVTAVSD